MDERLSRWLLLPPLLALLFLFMLYQDASPGGGCPNAPAAAPPPATAAVSPCGRPSGDFSSAPFLRGASLASRRRQQQQHLHRELQEASPGLVLHLASASRHKFLFGLSELCRRVHFDMRGRDVMVFLHIQKTGGTTFGRHLVRNIRLEQPCFCRAGQKKCTCHRPGAAPGSGAAAAGGGDKGDTWLFSRFSTGWSCGLHADWTELTSCVPAAMERREGCPANRTLRNFYYITMLRDPVSRYLSEWKHVQRGATWKTSLHMCDGRSPTPEELPMCYLGDDWSGVSLQEFMNCDHNLANNRQVRMLADLSLVGCYNLTSMNESERNIILLQSAKNNLKNMAFFGLTEFQRKTQYLFERTFNLEFISPFTQYNITRASNVDINESVRKRIEELNFLDMQLYEYAKDLFLQRFQYAKQEEHEQNRQKRREERKILREQKIREWQEEEEIGVTEDYNSQVERW
ncbi:heparan-sulfate 6-O-sulfotransferase 3 [Hemicordylus capensis]|uniref:heparan-sulfate 6-O-sulfotransferase 3 n=1 Tax=Hemicordylus capensis TaxID=884348 RepID=UPI0023034E90|nr:heparan-sulfate 6-O-sulfotransferase 3 [Hemicordylus capensis]